jgi:hypothetical protein
VPILLVNRRLSDIRRLIAFRFEIVRDKLRISGVPNYHFARATPAGQFQELKTLNRNCRQNRRLFTDINPIVYKTIDDFSKLVAFFNYINETSVPFCRMGTLARPQSRRVGVSILRSLLARSAEDSKLTNLWNNPATHGLTNHVATCVRLCNCHLQVN